MNGPHLVYFADPMCSWCWGFSPVLDAIDQRFGARLPVHLVLGGLRPGNRTPMGSPERDEIRRHWEHVHEASGQPFDFSFFERPAFVYDTEPASRAVVVMRRRAMTDGLAGLRRLQRAFYAENRDVTDPQTLCALAGELGFDVERFRADLDSDDAVRETRSDFDTAQRVGIRGFPTLIAGTGGPGEYTLVTHGFQPAQRLLPSLERWLDTSTPRARA
ncbi:MAG: DsbA family protein [Gammaproteobacteria bacterium]|nr:DsbA family protein [Gammaproteobacteria bacterium]